MPMSESREISDLTGKSMRDEALSIGKVLVNYDTSVVGDGSADPEGTILMPCLNGSETLEVCIRKARGFLEPNHVRGEIVLSDNGSPHGSQEFPSNGRPPGSAPPSPGFVSPLTSH